MSPMQQISYYILFSWTQHFTQNSFKTHELGTNMSDKIILDYAAETGPCGNIFILDLNNIYVLKENILERKIH